MRLFKIAKNSMWSVATALVVAMASSASAAPLNISDNPLFLNTSVPPLNMLIMGRDHKLYYEAYNDASDLDGDGTLDTGYKGWQLKVPAPPSPESPYKIDYFGYFDSFKCYSWTGTLWDPVATAGAGKTCAGTDWSGDYLNYLTTARIDALRKVMYGGDRITDNNTETVLERTYVPQDAHSWGKEYTSTAVDGYAIEDYTDLSQPSTGQKHFFANTTVRGTVGLGTGVYTQSPVLRIMQNAPAGRRVWHWVSKERPVAHATGNCIDGHAGCPGLIDRIMRVRVCKTGFLEGNCKNYPNGNNKPTGIIQDYGEGASPRMYFGLITGSYARNTSGGVLRRKMGSTSNPLSHATNPSSEINPDSGVFTGFNGIISTLNRMHPTGFRGAVDGNPGTTTNYDYSCGWITTRAINEGECQMWGNPVAEMMFESLRYFSGISSPLFNTTVGQGEEGQLPTLPVDTWDNPYAAPSSHPTCAKPFQTVISDINPNYDTDQLPGSYFNTFTNSDLPGLNVADRGQLIWNGEFGAGTTKKIFIGESGTNVNSAPSAKDATSFGNIRGLAPEDPTKRGGYYSGSVAYYGHETDINATAPGNQKVNTFAVALASPLPRIEIPVGTGRVTMVPFAKSVAGASINAASTSFQPTNQIVDFYVDSITATTGRFRVNFEDVEQGADHDMDAVVVYEYTVVGSNVTITLTSEYAAGGITQHMGYIISGTTRDGIYLEVVDQRTGDSLTDPVDYYLDTPPSFTAATSGPPAPGTGGPGSWNDGAVLPFIATRTFTAGTNPAADLLKDPLWYAAKWGGFEDSDASGSPNLATEWDENSDGKPDNYFLVTNALHLGQQLANAFDEISERVGSASSASVNAGSISSDTRVYQAKFNSGNWTGQLLSFPVQTVDNPMTPENEIGTLLAQQWDAAEQLPAHGSRKIITINADTGAAVPFRWDDIGATRQGQLQPVTDAFGPRRVDYLRGEGTHERLNGGQLRNRPTKLGDIVSSSPVFVGKPNFFYPDSLESAPYSAFVTANAARTPVVYAGANDGMLHAFNANTGAEMLGFIPSAVFPNLIQLTRPTYTHKFFVDGTPTIGDVFYGGAWHTVLVGGLNKGGKSIYALDITNPNLFSAESNAPSIFKWEFTDPDLGFTYSRPAVVRMQNGDWAAVFGNGYNSTGSEHASLFIVRISDGVLLRKISTLHSTAGTPNGLATPALVDIDGDSKVDYAYAGDLRGNMWKFNLTSTSAGAWDVAYFSGATPLPLFTARAPDNTRQPITSKPEVGRGPQGVGMVVLFGTGRFLELGDKSGNQTQSFYGVLDPNSGTAGTDRIASRADLTQQSILVQQNFSFVTPSGATITIPLRVTTQNAVANRGWYMDLLSPTGTNNPKEMQVSDSILRAGRIIFTTLIPDPDPCSPGGTSWLMEMDALTGGRLNESPFDNNRDGQFTTSDFVTVTLPDGSTVTVAVSGMQSEVGIAQRPGILSGETQEYKYLSGTTANAAGSNIQRAVENPGPNARGRQSWRQIK